MGLSAVLNMIELAAWSIFDFVRFLLLAIQTAMQQIIFVVFWAYSWVTVRVVMFTDPRSRPLAWDWRSIDCDDVAFPENFLWGVASSSHQVEGNSTNSNWSWWENQHHDGKSVILNGDKCGSACDHWNRLEDDTALMSNIGVNSSRFSLEWSKIEPSPCIKNQDAIVHYHEEIDLLKKAGIEPTITVLHFATPLWFYDIGGIEKEENNQYIIRFAVDMYKEFGHKVKWWVTLNEPTLLNLLKCHTEMYASIKAEAKRLGQDCMVGISLWMANICAAKWYNGTDYFMAYLLNLIFTTPTLGFLTTGKFRYYIPFMMNLKYFDKTAPASYDFLGVNFYHEVPLDYPAQTINAEGLYAAIKQMSTPELGDRPLIITECGISDFDDTRRKLFLKRYLFALSRAIRDGYNVQGFYYWTFFRFPDAIVLATNLFLPFRNLGYTTCFGLYSVDRTNQERKLKEGSREYARVLEKYKCGELRLKFREDKHKDSPMEYVCGGQRLKRMPPPNHSTGEDNL